ncbi:hypothetical protein D3C76_557470 [compost metagenome]
MLAKVLNDLRTASILSSTGYSSQAATIVSSLYESAFMIAYIGDNDNLANKWIEHEDATRLVITIKELTKQGLKKIDAPNYEELYLQEYNEYKQSSMIKHGTVEGDSVIAKFGPEASEFSGRFFLYTYSLTADCLNYSAIGFFSLKGGKRMKKVVALAPL